MFRNSQSKQLTRRELLRVGGLGAVGLTLPQLLAARGMSAENDVQSKADACMSAAVIGKMSPTLWSRVNSRSLGARLLRLALPYRS